MLAKFTLATLALAGTAFAQISNGGLSILVPGGPDLWWLAAQPNNIMWTCDQTTFTDFTVWINNANTTLLTAITPLIAIEQNFNCALLVTADLVTMPVGDGYTIQLSNPSNVSDIYAESAQFSIKPLSVGYPASSATPTDTATATVSKGTASNVASLTGSGSGSSAAPTSSGKSAAVSTRVGAVGAVAMVGAGVVAALL